MAVTVNKAQFKINASVAANRGYEATSAQVLTIQLEDATDVSSVRYELYDVSDPNSPLASLSAPDLTFAGGVHSKTLNPASGSTTATMVTDGAATHSWLMRATAATDSGEHVYERIISLKNGKPRKTVPGESTQWTARGWSDAWSELVDYVTGVIGGGGYSTIQDEGVSRTQRTTLNFVGAGVSAVDSGGITVVTIPGGSAPSGSAVGQTQIWNGSAWVAGALDLADGDSHTGILGFAFGGTGLSALGTALQSIRVNAGATGLEYYTPSAGVTAGNGLTGTTTFSVLAENATIAVSASGVKRAAITGDVTIADGSNTSAIAAGVIVDADVNIAAALAYSKLAAGTAGRWLTINASGVVIESDTALGSKKIQHSAADALGAILTLYATRGTSAAPTANNALDILGGILAQGYDGSAAFNAGQLQFKVIQAAGTSKRARAVTTIHDGSTEITTGQFERFPPTTTTDATSTTIANVSVSIPADSTVKISFLIHGQQSSNVAHRETSLTVRRSGSGTIAEISHTDGVALFRDDATWGDSSQIGYFINDTTHAVDIIVKGKAATTIVWTGEVSSTVFT